MKEYPNKPYSLSGSLKRRGNEYFGRYRGTVLDNEDPDERGRCKVFVYGVYNESFNKDKGKNLPWAEPLQPLFCGGMGEDGTNGSFQCPDLGSTVFVFFDSGDITRPIMFGQTTDKNGKFSTRHCKFKWEKMYIDLCRDEEKGTNVISISADTDINETANTNNINRRAGTNINDEAQFIVNITAIDENVNIKGGIDVNIEAVSGNVNIKGKNNVNVTAGTEVNITAPNINLTGDTKIDGKCHITNQTEIDSPTTIHSMTKINADANIGGKSFLAHVHGVITEGAPTTPPV